MPEDDITNNALVINKGSLKKKNGLFSDIDQISFDTHPPPPKDDIWKNY